MLNFGSWDLAQTRVQDHLRWAAQQHLAHQALAAAPISKAAATPGLGLGHLRIRSALALRDVAFRLDPSLASN